MEINIQFDGVYRRIKVLPEEITKYCLRCKYNAYDGAKEYVEEMTEFDVIVDQDFRNLVLRVDEYMREFI